jgi:EmrB/QacA subfamily drug resistance transporter
MISTKQDVRLRRLAFALLCIAQFMVVLDFSIVNVALPSMQHDLGFTTQTLQWVVSAYALTFGGFLLLGGRAADLFGRRRLFIGGLALFSLASLAGGFAPSSTWFIAARAVQGLGAALVAPTALALITTMFAEGPARNRVLGIVGAVSSSGFAAGAILGGLLTAGPGWRWVMFVNVPIGIVAIILAPFLLEESSRDLEHRHIDVIGALTVTIGLTALVYALVEGNDLGWLSLQTISMLMLALVLLVVFVIAESRSPAPLVRLGIFRLRTLTGGNLVGLLLSAVFGSLVFILTLYMQKVLGYSAISTGLAFLPMALIVIIVSNIASRLVARVGVKPFLVGGMAVLAAGMLFFARTSAFSGFLEGLLPGMLITAIGFGSAAPTMVIAGTAGVSDSEQGLASGLINTMRQVGAGVGLAVTAAVSSARTAALVRSGEAIGNAALSGGFSLLASPVLTSQELQSWSPYWSFASTNALRLSLTHH